MNLAIHFKRTKWLSWFIRYIWWYDFTHIYFYWHISDYRAQFCFMGTEFTYSLKICIGPAKMCTRKLYMNDSCLLQCLSSSCPMSLSSYRTSWYYIALLEYNKILLGKIYCEDMGVWLAVFWCRASSLTPVESVLGTFHEIFGAGPGFSNRASGFSPRNVVCSN